MQPAKLWLAFVLLAASAHPELKGQTPPPPVISSLNVSNNQVGVRFAPYPAAQAYSILSATNPTLSFLPDARFFQAPYILSASTNGTNYGYEWRLTNNTAPRGFYRVQVTPLSSNALLSATVLNRLTYGPTPDELARIAGIGPQAYIDEQLAPWNLTEDAAGTHPNIPLIQSKLVEPTNYVYRTNATLADLRAWHLLRAVGARRQLLEILLQFLENHFVTQYTKSSTWFGTYFDDSTEQGCLATQLEYRENELWRNALLNPQCTFYDLLKISAESPAMLIYLDTVQSRGDGKNIANENYARELMELFSMGVDNGYDQTDVTVQSRVWTGWRVDIVDFTNVFNPLAPVTTAIIPGSTNTSITTKSNLFGAWAFNYKGTYHNTSTKNIFTNKFIPARFGAPWTTKTYGTNTVPGLYEIDIPGHSGTDTNGLSEGYQFLNYLANLPFTEEYVSIKLCRLLVSDNFPNPSDDPGNPVYPIYNYAAGNLSPEADLVHQCMLTWETNSPKGQLWPVLRTIVNSDLFRGNGAAQQKIKTPLEYTVSAVRALRSSTNGSNLAGSFTAFTDGYAIGGSSASAASPLSRMGTMLLFDRDAPDGYPETGPPWISAGTVCERLRWVQSFCLASGQSGHTGSSNDAGNSVSDIVGLLKAKVPAASWNDAGAVTDYFLALLYPGEGAGNLGLYRAAAVNLLNDGSADSPASSTPFSALTVSNSPTSAYDQRVRAMVGLLMTMERFQEQ